MARRKARLVSSSLTVVWLVALTLTLPGFCAADGLPASVLPVVRGGSIDFPVADPAVAIELTVSGPEGEVARHIFSAGSLPTLALLRSDGSELADGSYTWQLRALSVRLRSRSEAEAVAEATPAPAAGEAGWVVSGGFAIVEGAAIAGEELEPRRSGGAGRPGSEVSAAVAAGGPTVSPMDQVIPDDLIVQGSLCTGLDCVNNESFGFDTIRMKENNIRIKFDDTSVGSFPATDWQLTANDSASGGLNKFSIEDITASLVPFTIEGGADTNSLYIDDAGRVGLRTATPVLDLHISTGNTPGERLEQTGASGFTPQTWDIAGNEANFFVRDVTGGSLLPFRIRPGAPTSSIDIAADGEVGIGTASPEAKLHVNGDSIRVKKTANAGNAQIGLEMVSAGGTVDATWAVRNNPRNGALQVTDNVAGPAPFKIFPANPPDLLVLRDNRLGIGGVANPTQNIDHASGAKLIGGNWTNASSRELKTGIADLAPEVARETLQGLQPVTFAYRSNPEDRQVGFIAEDVPDLVATEDHRGLSAMDVVAVLTGVVKQQQQAIEELEARLRAVEASGTQQP